MSQGWTAPTKHVVREAYLDWGRTLAFRRDKLMPQRPDGGIPYAPVFVRLNTGVDPLAARVALRDLIADSESPLLMDDAEAKMLGARIQRPLELSGLPDEYMIYRRLGTSDSAHATVFTVLDTGTPVYMPLAVSRPDAPDPVPPTPRKGAPIVAIIDDGIGFLNARFRRRTAQGDHESRFHALWLQALEQLAPTPRGALSGRVLDRIDINQMIATGDERACYAAVNAALYAKEARDETAYATTHGTHVLDLAAGADPDSADDPVRDWPLLGVQLPPEAIDDTSGTCFESYLVMGLRWILRQARQIDVAAPVIVNLSLGVLAGPKDGSRFAEYQVAREAAHWEQVTGQPVRIVWAFGNGYRSSQVARLTFDGVDQTARNLHWRVQPQDETASFVEIHVRGAQSSALKVALSTPDGQPCDLLEMDAGMIRSLRDTEGNDLARIYHVPERRFDSQTTCPAHYVLALAPTRGTKNGEPEASPGAWRIDAQCSEPADVLVQVQRDDAMRGGAAHGRQSYLDHADAFVWDPARAAYVAPATTGPITDAGCHNALVTAPSRQVFCVGAARRTGQVPEQSAVNYHAAAFSGQGADWSVPGPTAATIIGEGAFFGGVRAAGTLSGSTRRLSGTSAAAGQMSRALGLSASRIVQNKGNGTSTQMDDLDPQTVGLIDTASPDPRLGAAIVVLPEDLPAC